MKDGPPDETEPRPDLGVVIVDDRPTNRAIFSQLAASAGHNVRTHTFGDAFEALRWLDHNAADLVITDFKMPGLDGAGFINRLRRSRLNADVPAVVITAYAEREFRVRALEAGATDFLHSPVDAHEFQTRVRNLLRMGTQQRLTRSRAAELAVELGESEATRLRVIRESRKLLAQVIDTVPALISARDRDGRLIFVNAHQAASAGLAAASLLGSDAPLFGPAHHDTSAALDARVFATGEALPSFEEEICLNDGTARFMLTTKAPLHDDAGVVTGVLTTSIDITARRDAERRLKQLARQDALTGLRNRSWFLESLQSEVAHSRRGDRAFAVHFLDLDRFKLINDGQGHHVGDMLLHEVATRVLGVVGEKGIVARLGGDEFGILQTGSPSPHEAAALASALVTAIDQPVMLDGMQVATSASIGIAMHPRDGRSGADLLRNADLAMYRVKLEGRHGFQFCGDDAKARDLEAKQLEADLRSALARHQLMLHFQPQFDIQSNAIVGAEALLRWSRPTWGLLAPAAFLAVAERSGLVGPIGEWVLNEVCQQLIAWSARSDQRPVVAVNISASQAHRPDMAQSVLGALEAAGIEPGHLQVEVTEACILAANAAFATNMARLRAAGVGVCVDNFGVSGLSLPVLQRAGISRVKLDLSVVHALGVGTEAVGIVRTAVAFGQSLSAEVAAVGIETQAQLDMLRDEGVAIAQGILLGRPADSRTFATLLPRKPDSSERPRFNRPAPG